MDKKPAANKPIPVIFRVWEKELCAYFPTLTWAGPHTITCYAHIGQHGGADRACLQKGRLATPEEYADLLRELRGIYENDRDPEQVFPLVVLQRSPSRSRKAAKYHWE